MFAKTDFGAVQGGSGASGGALWLTHGLKSSAKSAAQHVSTKIIRKGAGDWRSRIKYWAEDVNLTPDLGQNIGSRQWLRGAATCFALCFAAVRMTPDFAALPAAPEPVMTAASYDEFRSQMITPLALGADSGRHMGPTDAVAALRETPERPMIQLSAAIGHGDSFRHALTRAGVSSADSAAVMELLGDDAAAGTLTPGTRLNLTLGRRENRNMARPLDALAFRARLDLAIDVTRENGALVAHRMPIAVDNTPLRIRGVVTDSLYRAARAAGATPGTVQTYLRVIGKQMSLGKIRAGDRFDIIVAHRRAATGETETGALLYGGLQLASGKKIDMLKWDHGGKSEWFEASGVGQTRPGLARPVTSARLSSGFGMRFHPILGYSRLHAGVDYAARTGTPIYAVTDGRVSYAGRHGGHGNYVKLTHNGGLATGYAHMSRIAVHSGERVKRGQVIGYVGSTGLSTGPHLHYEVYRNGKTVNPTSVKFEETPQLAGSELKQFRSRLASLKSISNSPVLQAPATPPAAPEVRQASTTKTPAKIAMR
ncbi:MAG: peptidoglycan DD-metalloendopeptidase family protein [Sphingobium sp.]